MRASVGIYLEQEGRLRRSSKPRIQKREGWWFLYGSGGLAIAHSYDLGLLLDRCAASWQYYLEEGWV